MKRTYRATTAEAALDILRAATKQIEGELLAYAPGDFRARDRAEAVAPVTLSISLDLTALIEITTEKHDQAENI
ncbi:hypothetical protein [Streptomyces goshikiensis]|uniref:hypothetical protein n=1 Tax=Streptomyces goshikiensis TaxID=1942 RepID=UPI002E0D71CA|nr:hypothetical protein OG224_06770 [Streptomyces goshikiensis]